MAAVKQAVDDQIDVLRRHNKPAHFLWRGRLYGVRTVLDHWIEMDQQLTLARSQESSQNYEFWTSPSGESAARGGPREVWRVEASAGRCAQPMTFELSVSSRDSWTLAEVGHSPH